MNRIKIFLLCLGLISCTYSFSQEELSLIHISLEEGKRTAIERAKIQALADAFGALVAQTLDSTLGLRCTMFGYQYSEILRSLMCVYLCGGSCIEDVTTHLMKRCV